MHLTSPLELLQKTAQKQKKLLSVENLSVSFSIEGKELQAVRGISFDVFEGETVGIVGESGSGKTAAVQAITRLSAASKIEGKILFQGENLLALSEDKIRKICGKEIGSIFQDPMHSLNPTMRIGPQLTEGLIYHRLASHKEAIQKAEEILELVGLSSPSARMNQYPHELSGGMQQRILIAIALITHPRLVIADEPTTALDVTIQAQILDLLSAMQKRLQTSLLLITHDLGVVAEICDRVLVFYAGKIVEQGSVAEILQNPRHPYTQMLLRAIPSPSTPKQEPLYSIEGSLPSLFNPPKGCVFEARCPFAASICRQEPPFFGRAACWREKP